MSLVEKQSSNLVADEKNEDFGRIMASNTHAWLDFVRGVYEGPPISFLNISTDEQTLEDFSKTLPKTQFLQASFDFSSPNSDLPDGKMCFVLSREDAIIFASAHKTGKYYTDVSEDMISTFDKALSAFVLLSSRYFKNVTGKSLNIVHSSNPSALVEFTWQIDFPERAGTSLIVAFDIHFGSVNKTVRFYQLATRNYIYHMGMLVKNQNIPSLGTPMGKIPYATEEYAKEHIPVIRPVKFSALDPPKTYADDEDSGIRKILDVGMKIRVELGQTKKTIRDILLWGEGTIVGLTKLAGEPMDVLINNSLVAKGEVMVIDNNFTVRITEIVASNEFGDPIL